MYVKRERERERELDAIVLAFHVYSNKYARTFDKIRF